MNDMTTSNEKPLSAFNKGAHNHGSNNLKYAIIVVIVIALAGYFGYRFYKGHKEEQFLNTNIEQTVQKNQDILRKRMESGMPPISEEATLGALNVIEESLKNR